MIKRLPMFVAALLATACQTAAPGGVKTAITPSAPPVVLAASVGAVPDGVVAPAGVTVTGSVRVPAGIIAAGGMNLVAAGGMNLVAAGGMNLVAAGGGNYTLLAIDEQAVAGARVFLADAAGSPIPGLPGVVTDAKGDYTIADVPPDFTFVVAAEVDLEGGKKATFQTLVKPGKLGATASLDAASTLVAANLLEGISGSDLGEFNPATFKTATETTKKNLVTAKLPDFSDRASVRLKMQALVDEVVELRTNVDTMRGELATVKKTLEELKAQLQRPRPGQLPPGVRPSGEPGKFFPPVGPQPSSMGSNAPPTSGPSGQPSGMPPKPPGEACVLPGNSHSFEVPDPERIATIEFRMPQPGQRPETWPNGGTGRKDFGYSTQVPEGCPLHVVYKDAGGVVLGVVEGFVIPAGSQQRIVLPKPTRFPTTATPSAPPSGQPSAMPSPQPSGQPSGSPSTMACTAKVTHKVRVTTAGAKYIKFGVPSNGGTPGQIVAETVAAQDGSFTVLVPEGCPHQVGIFDGTGKALGMLPRYTIPTGAPTEINIPL